MTMTDDTQQITWTRLRSGDWGVRGPAQRIRKGATVPVTKRDGSTKQATIERVLWTDNEMAIAAVSQRRETQRVSWQQLCPICGEEDMFDGASCMECGYGEG